MQDVAGATVDVKGEGLELEGADVKVESVKIQDARRVREIFVQCVYPRWQELVDAKADAMSKVKAGLESPKKQGYKDVKGKGRDEGLSYTQAENSDRVVFPPLVRHSERKGLDRFDCGEL
jgi:hypothetical protein